MEASYTQRSDHGVSNVHQLQLSDWQAAEAGKEANSKPKAPSRDDLFFLECSAYGACQRYIFNLFYCILLAFICHGLGEGMSVVSELPRMINTLLYVFGGQLVQTCHVELEQEIRNQRSSTWSFRSLKARSAKGLVLCQTQTCHLTTKKRRKRRWGGNVGKALFLKQVSTQFSPRPMSFFSTNGFE